MTIGIAAILFGAAIWVATVKKEHPCVRSSEGVRFEYLQGGVFGPDGYLVWLGQLNLAEPDRLSARVEGLPKLGISSTLYLRVHRSELKHLRELKNCVIDVRAVVDGKEHVARGTLAEMNIEEPSHSDYVFLYALPAVLPPSSYDRISIEVTSTLDNVASAPFKTDLVIRTGGRK